MFPVRTATAADDDGDGSQQLSEYLHGTNPDDATERFTAFADFDAEGEFRLISRLDTNRADVVLFFQRSAYLKSWTESAAFRSSAVPPTGIVPISVAESLIPSDGLQQVFARTVRYLGRPVP